MRGQKRPVFRSPGRRHGTRRQILPAAVAMTVGLMAPLAPPAASASGPDTVQQSLNALVRDGGVPAALASVKGPGGRDRTYTAGTGDLATGAPVPVDGQVRIGSNTKTFVAVVVLQLVAERRVSLDAFVDTYLPGLVRGEGIDGRRITVRHLLQQTSGLPEYTSRLGDDVRYYAPRELLATALRHPADFAPGKRWKYSNTNYVLAGLIVQKITGRPLADEIDRRIIQRIGLRHTYFPAPGDATIREPHPHGYYRESAQTPLRDITEMDPSWGWAAGQMISTNSDLNRFFTALLTGRLLPAPQLARMRSTVPAEATFGPGARYGLGLVSRPLPCGGLSWGHGGSFPGYETRGGVTEAGRAANVAVTVQLTDEAARRSLEHAVDTALCR
ncbi:beta-lactamase family protein [Streptomyces anulatus]|uniref:serine hydrolase domain-containing protein n=1 Tax=Streptomyces TaxID=1883 RepID=UPI0006F9CA3D|nr:MULTISPECIES: serine hydrolase domain-containing protein [unclassified Streptomyces]KQX37568.1 serine hydrolase [Streptomyces sp. Root1295]KRA43363.1 serine hydrolase [Streptomyces sp. Root63]